MHADTSGANACGLLQSPPELRGAERGGSVALIGKDFVSGEQLRVVVQERTGARPCVLLGVVVIDHA